MLNTRSRSFLRAVLCAALVGQLIAFMPAAPAVAAVPSLRPTPTETWVPNGPVKAIAEGDDGTIYIGGEFDYVGPYCGASVRVNSTSGETLTLGNNAEVAGIVYAQVGDGSGGYFLGGVFTHVGGVARQGLVHVLADGTVDPVFDAHCDMGVVALARSGSTLYVGGSFSHIGGQPRQYIAALSTTTGSATTWNPGADAGVTALAVRDPYIYAGGPFTTIGGAPRAHIARLHRSSDAADSWNPADPDADVLAIAATDQAVYVGGDFQLIGAATRKHLAKLDATTAALDTTWVPSTNNQVNAIALSGSSVYVGGDFTQVNALGRTGIVRVDASNGLPDAWAPNPNDGVRAITISGDSVYVGGTFTEIAGVHRLRAAQLSVAAPATATSFAPNVGHAVLNIGIYGHAARLSGAFSSVDGRERNNLAALDPATGALTPWNPDVNRRVNAIVTAGSTVYIGGNFTQVGAATRNHVAAISADTGGATAFNANAGGDVFALAISGSTLYLGGDFTLVGGQNRPYLAAVNAANGSLVAAWDPVPTSSVYALAASGSALYVGGQFAAVDATPRNYAAALALSDGALLAWDPAANSSVMALAVSGTTVYAGGTFDTIGATSRDYLAALDASTGLARNWNPAPDGLVEALVASGSTVYAAGGFQHIGGQARWAVAALNASDGSATSWNQGAWTVGLDATMYDLNSLCLAAGSLYAGGSTGLLLDPPPQLARFDVAGPLAVVPIAGANRYATAVEVSKKAFPAGADWVVVVTGENWPDALGGSALAGALHGPILLTKKAAMPSEVLAEITRLGADKAIILGSTAAVSSAVESALEEALGASDVTRLGGSNRYETARMVAARTVAELGGGYDGKAFAATGANFPDALGASPLAAKMGWPIYLVNPSGLDAGTLSAMQSAGVTKTVVLGSAAAVSATAEQALKTRFGAANVTRVAGPNRYATAVEVAKYGVANAGLGWDKLAIATGQNFPDALAGGALQARSNSVLMLTPTASLDSAVRSTLVANKAVIYQVRFLGGPTAVSNAVRSAVVSALN